MSRLDPNNSLGYHCNLTVKAFLAAWEEKLKGTGVSPAQVMALAQLVVSSPLSQSELVGRLSITPASGVGLIDRMERDGWVTRKPDPRDGRVKQVVPTPQAMDIWGAISQTGREVLEQAYAGISADELETVKRVLKAVRENLKA